MELSKWRIFFYQNGELFRSDENGELLYYENGELFLSKRRTFFIIMANFALRLFSKWRIFRFSQGMSHRFHPKKVEFLPKPVDLCFQKNIFFSLKSILSTPVVDCNLQFMSRAKSERF